MTTDPVTLPFLTYQGLYPALAALGLLAASGLVWLMLSGVQRGARVTLPGLLAALGWVLAPVWLWLFGATLWGLWQVFNGLPSPLAGGSLGLGTLIAAFLAAPYVVYGTWLKHRTGRLEQEGHMTDRITAAVEQLGADKTEKVYTLDDKRKPIAAERTVPNIEVRIGAILSLERIAQDSTLHDNGRDHVRVMEILCAYIRENSNARKPVDFPLPDWEPLADDATEEERAAHLEWRKARFSEVFGGNAMDWAASLPKPRTDVQLALTVIGRRSAQQRRVEAAWPDPPTEATVWPFDTGFKRLPDDPDDAPLGKEELDAFTAGLDAWKKTLHDYRGYRLDLRGANLQGADMAAKQPDGSDAVFSGARLNGARIEGGDLRKARMKGADLSAAFLRGADVCDAWMDGATLTGSRMEGARLSGASLAGANLSIAHIEGAKLRHANISRANLQQAWMELADLVRARMEGAVLQGARMERAKLNGGRLERADFRFARMEAAELTLARLEGATLLGAEIGHAILAIARLEGADFRGVKIDKGTNFGGAVFRQTAITSIDWSSANISQEQIDATFGDASVVLPKGITRPAHWPDWRLPSGGEHEFEAEWHKWQADPASYRPPPKPAP
jgi:uncharacterized protein YjbI with pentapeptide repeats